MFNRFSRNSGPVYDPSYVYYPWAKWLALSILAIFGLFLIFNLTEKDSASEINSSENTNRPTNKQVHTPEAISHKLDSQPESQPKSALYAVVSVTDGDTLKVSIDGRTETIRIIGLDTPETKDPRKPVQCFGEEASNKMHELAHSRNVRLESDPTQGDRDNYSRLLRHVFTEDGVNIAKQMIMEGYGHEYTYKLPYTYQAEYKNAQTHATNNSLGLWSPNTCNGNTEQSPSTPQTSSTDNVSQSQSVSQSNTSSSTYYRNCTAARAAGAAPVFSGQPGYGGHLDRDGDGVGCE